MKQATLFLLAGTVVLAALAAPAAAQCQFVTPPAPIPGEVLGGHIARDGDLMLVSSTIEVMQDVHVFRRDFAGWTYEATLEPPGGLDFDSFFGQEIALSGDVAAIGAHGSLGGLGSVYLFRRTEDPLSGVGSWAFDEQVISKSLLINQSFGRAIDIQGDVLAVGAPTNDALATNAGAVELFDLSSGSAVSTGVLLSPAAIEDGFFGRCVVLNGTRLLVGATGEGTGVEAGRGFVSVYGFTGSSWIYVDRFTSANSSARGFGYQIVFASAAPIPTVFVSAPFTFVGGSTNAGQVYRLIEQPIVGGFVWLQTDAFQSPEPEQNANFGRELSVYKPVFFGPTRIAVNDCDLQSEDAKVRLFESLEGGWVLARTLVSPPQATRTFGDSLFVDGRELLVGNPFRTIDVQLQGGVYVFAHGDCPDTRRLDPPGLASGDRLGTSAAAGADVVLFGLPGEDALGTDAGAVWSFAPGPDGWEREQVLTDLTPAEGDGFGAALAVKRDGSLAFAGAPLDDGSGLDSGRVHVYARSGGAWVAAQEIPCPSPRTDGRFGAAIATFGRWLVVGEPGPDAAAGRAFVFEDVGGTFVEHSTLVPDDPFAAGSFGVALSAAPGRIAVGDPRDADAGADAGAVYVFARDAGLDAWLVEHKVPGAAPGDAFARALAIVADNLVVGAPGAVVAGTAGAGAAYVFRLEGRTLVPGDLLTENSPRPDAHFGIAVAGEGSRIAVAADAAGNTEPGRVRVYLEVGSSLFPGRSVAPLDASSSALFGSSLALRDGIVFAGAPGDDREGSDSGSAWVFAAQAGPPGAFLFPR